MYLQDVGGPQKWYYLPLYGCYKEIGHYLLHETLILKGRMHTSRNTELGEAPSQADHKM